ncbi:MAG: hypothetical protein O2826_03430 [Chloroflexi bacterium]|nr:hypothetical protein [Chloroflexota bacterium]MDA1173553.1 hypothetical protein [Chloroflexota bacterium]
MTERNVATVMERLMGEHAPYLHEGLTQTVAGRVVGRRPARAVVINLNDIRSHLRGVAREFTEVESVEVYM